MSHKFNFFKSPLFYLTLTIIFLLALLLIKINDNFPVQVFILTPALILFPLWSFQERIFKFAEIGEIERVAKHINQLKDTKLKGKIGYRILHIASDKGHQELVDILAKRGVNINALCEDSFTALHRAVLSNHLEVVKTLINYGAEVNCQDINGFTSLHIAVINNNLEIISTLIENEAQVNSRLLNGTTPLSLALQSENQEIVGFLSSHGGIN
ncbi:ankyrin repeat domain-containing protein [Oscillatoria salina]|uniref:ankyrin repeat domain-containing protein n=1 Tax=Oscillatoria salina TaxID=331517 RepID=UPI001CD0014E|nr:ankyrin repeat domain-containing protein [Oscillatoria salina]MBZ8181148.1 ankyrin repeat domain-containing protein [Oscillatoria salina IIICB1]